jgi:parallel beta-helix repeat protein
MANAGTNYVVDNGGDADDFLTYTAGNGTNTLRKCLRLANSTANGGIPHTIGFSVTTVTLTSSLPSINNVNAAGMTISGAGPGPTVTIIGVGAYNEIINPNGVNGIIVKNLRITNCAPCVHIVSASNCIIQGCHLGTDASSAGIQTLSTTSTRIVQIEGSAASTTNNIVGGNLTLTTERNLIVGAGQDGSAIYITGGAIANIIKGNYIGTTTTGNAVWSKDWGSGSVSGGNNASGIFIENSNSNIVGGASATDRNIISGNRQHGIRVFNSDNCQISNNYLGLGQNGTTALANGNFGGTTIYNNITVESGSDNLIIQSNVISNCPNNGIGSLSGTNNSITIKGNYIGLDATGTSSATGAMGNLRNGIFISNGTGHNIGGTGGTTDRNIICNNGTASSNPSTCSYYGDTGPGGFWGAGISLRDVITVTIQGNYIGVDISGNTARGNSADGIYVENSATGNTTITIGGSTTSARNIVCANGFGNPSNNYVWPCRRNGIKFYQAGGVTIQNNYIGLAADGTTVLGNGLSGVGGQSSSNNTIQNNVFCGNDWGVTLENNANNNLIYGNLIGVKADGTTAAGNGLPPVNPVEGAGVVIQGSTGNRVGNSGAGQGNTIANNRINILFRKDWTSSGATGNYIQNNVISNAAYTAGTRGNTTYDVNAMGAGIALLEGSNNNFIGGTAANEPNQIYSNDHNGIYISASNKNEIRRNSLYCNGSSYADNSNDEKGINLDLSSGSPGNNSYTAPVVYSNTLPAPPNSDANNLRGTAPANSQVEIFSIEPCLTCPVSGGVQTEGKTYRTTVTADASGNWIWTPGVPLDGQYTATATEPTSVASPRNTSEFSTCGYITLPVELLSFTGHLNDGSIVLDWSTASEKNNSYFSIQRSFDGKSFSTIGTVRGNGNTDQISNYSYSDYNVDQAVVYYRLMQTDESDKSSLSTIIQINIQSDNVIRIYPNPNQGLVNIDLSVASSSYCTLQLLDAVGNQIYREEGNVHNGYDQKKIDMHELAAGVYLLKVETDENNWVERIIKK